MVLCPFCREVKEWLCTAILTMRQMEHSAPGLDVPGLFPEANLIAEAVQGVAAWAVALLVVSAGIDLLIGEPIAMN